MRTPLPLYLTGQDPLHRLVKESPGNGDQAGAARAVDKKTVSLIPSFFTCQRQCQALGFLWTAAAMECNQNASGLFDQIKRRCLVACLLEPLDLMDGFTDCRHCLASLLHNVTHADSVFRGFDNFPHRDDKGILLLLGKSLARSSLTPDRLPGQLFILTLQVRNG